MANIIDNKRIAKNTVMLYIRTLVVLLVSLYTSRVILQVLGVNDYGIYQVVGGLVSMFTIISGVFTFSISRFITYELGTGNKEKLHRIFSSALIIQFLMCGLIILLVEGFGLWFIDHKMTVSPDQIWAVRWVLQFSIITFCLGLISVPYNACIVAHERMKAFAYISMIEVFLKLGACYLLLLSSSNRLILYAALLALIALAIRSVYSIYCYKNFDVCRGKLQFDKAITKEMFSFSTWNLIVNTAGILNIQGVTMLVNVFFGLTVNAARGLAGQVESAVMQFVNNFTMALNPQITKSYAANDHKGLYLLLCRSAKFAPMAMMVLMIPLLFEMNSAVKLWLGTVPEYTVTFARLALLIGFVDCIGNSAYTACMAAGKIKFYSLIITPIGYLNFALIWLAFFLGFSVVWAYWIYLFSKIAINIVRLFLLKRIMEFPILHFLRNVYVPIILVGLISIILPSMFYFSMPEDILRIIVVGVTSVISVCLTVYYLGLNKSERHFIYEKVIVRLRHS